MWQRGIQSPGSLPFSKGKVVAPDALCLIDPPASGAGFGQSRSWQSCQVDYGRRPNAPAESEFLPEGALFGLREFLPTAPRRGEARFRSHNPPVKVLQGLAERLLSSDPGLETDRHKE